MISHADALEELMAARFGIAVAGTHGKSATTALVAYLLWRKWPGSDAGGGRRIDRLRR